jgi:hypothetical protein
MRGPQTCHAGSSRRRVKVTCPFHLACVRKHTEDLAAHAHSIIDENLGRVHNNDLEGGFSHIFSTRWKNRCMSSDMFKLNAILGLLRSNAAAMRASEFRGKCNSLHQTRHYSWLLEVLLEMHRLGFERCSAKFGSTDGYEGQEFLHFFISTYEP